MPAMKFYPIDMVDQASKLRPDGYREDLMEGSTPLFDAAGNMRAIMMTDAQFAAIAAKYRDAPARKEPPAGGPGTELKAMLAMLGISASPNCSCNARARKMDEMGSGWCKENVGTIVGWLQEEAHKRRLPFSRFAARKVVQIAISRAVRKEPKSASIGA